jgi:hypothetical protein
MCLKMIERNALMITFLDIEHFMSLAWVNSICHTK